MLGGNQMNKGKLCELGSLDQPIVPKSRFAGFVKAAGLAAALFALVGNQSLGATAPAPIGLDVDGTEYALISNAGWQVSTDGGTKFVAAKQVVLIRAAIPAAYYAIDRQNYAYIWAPTCVASK